MRNIFIRRVEIKLSILWKFLFSYLLVVTLILLVLSPLFSTFSNITKENYIERTDIAFLRSIELLNQSINEIYQLPIKLEHYSQFSDLKSYKGATLPLTYYSKILLSHKVYSSNTNTITLPNEIFLLMKNNGVVLDKKRSFYTLEEFLSYELMFKEDSIQIFKDILYDDDLKTKMIPISSMEANGNPSRDSIILLNRRAYDSVVMGAVFSVDNICKIFNIEDLPENSFIYIADSSGDLIMSYRFNNLKPIEKNSTEYSYNYEDFSILRQNLPMTNSEIVIGIPYSYFDSLLLSLRDLIMRYLYVSILVGVAISILLAFYSFRPIKKLISLPQSLGFVYDKSIRNEYSYINEYMKLSYNEINKLKSNVSSLENTLRTNLFARLMCGTIHSDDDVTLAVRLMPELTQSYRIVIVKADIGDLPNADYLSYVFYDSILNLTNNSLKLTLLDRTRVAVLLPESNGSIEKVDDIINLLTSSLRNHNLVITAGISEPVTGVEKIHIAYCHSQFSLNNINGASVAIYNTDNQIESWTSALWNDIQDLYDLIMSCEIDAVKDTFYSIICYVNKYIAYSGDIVAQAFYLARSAVESTISESMLDKNEFQIPQYHANDTVEELFKEILNFTLCVIEKKKENISSSGKILHNDILDYINKNYAEPSVYAEIIAEKFGVSRSTVYNIVRNETGNSLNEYIEQLRMKKAMNLLKESDIPISEIAKNCGYSTNNTFYKAFKRYHILPPSSYRNNQIN